MLRNSIVIAAIMLQFVIVTVMIFSAVLPLWTGREVLLAAGKVDPRDLMRGDYVRLDYALNRIDVRTVESDIKGYTALPYGDYLYVSLQQTDTGAVPTRLSRTQPDSGLFVRGMPEYGQVMPNISDSNARSLVYLRYGIEEYYTDPSTAKSLEQSFNNGDTSLVRVMIDESGRARVKDLVRKR